MKPDLEQLYDDQVWNVYGFFAYRVPSRADAEDLTQLTFERAVRSWHRFDPRVGAAGPWLLAIARNLLIDHYRRDRSTIQDPLDDEGIAEPSGPTGAGPERGLGVEPDLATALARLSQREREVIALRFGGELSGPEIAELLALSLANVQQLLSRSLRKLRAALESAAAPPSQAPPDA